MTWRNDGHGLRVGASEVKFFGPSHSWGMKLSQLARQSGTVRIMTYSLPSIDYIDKQFARRPHDIEVICHARFHERAQELKDRFPDILIALHNETHAKLLLIEPSTVYVGSANFGDSGWFEVCVGVRSKEAHDWYVQTFDRAWKESYELVPSNSPAYRPYKRTRRRTVGIEYRGGRILRVES